MSVLLVAAVMSIFMVRFVIMSSKEKELTLESKAAALNEMATKFEL